MLIKRLLIVLCGALSAVVLVVAAGHAARSAAPQGGFPGDDVAERHVNITNEKGDLIITPLTESKPLEIIHCTDAGRAARVKDRRYDAIREILRIYGGNIVQLPPNRDPREVFADWLIRPENPWFTKNIVNRVWAWLLGRGIIEEPDDIREDNPPSNPELLAYLQREFVDSGYDLKHLYRLILTSTTYQFSSVPRFKTPEAAALFATYPLRRLDAEILIDSINSITGTTDLYTSAIPEPFTYIPKDQPAIALADGSITSPFLTLFGRSARATGMMNERNNKPVSSQWLYILNSSEIQQKLDRGPKLRAMIGGGRKPEKTIELLYLTILSRRPTADEVDSALAYGSSGKRKTRNDWVDIAWSLINSTEFLYRH